MHFSNLMFLSCLGLCISMALHCLALLFLPGKTKTLDQRSIPTILKVVPVSDTTLPIPVHTVLVILCDLQSGRRNYMFRMTLFVHAQLCVCVLTDLTANSKVTTIHVSWMSLSLAWHSIDRSTWKEQSAKAHSCVWRWGSWAKLVLCLGGTTADARVRELKCCHILLHCCSLHIQLDIP